MNVIHLVTDSSVMVLDPSNGKQVKFFVGDDRYDRAIDMIRNGEAEFAFELDTKHIVENFFDMDSIESDVMNPVSVSVSVRNGVGIVTLHNYNDMEVELENGITQRIIKMSEQGFHPRALINFIGNLYSNPSATAVKELYDFIEACELPITEDGCFIAYKIVRGDYLDIYSGKMSNRVGEVLSMPRHLVDDKRENICSRGLHFCSKEYLPRYGSNQKEGDRCMLVKIDPADVVSIPVDYNNAKGRTWQYEVVGEMAEGWRTWLVEEDYTEDAVVSYSGQKLEPVVSSLGRDLMQASKVKALSSKEQAYRSGYADGYKDADNGDEPNGFYGVSVEALAYERGYQWGYRDCEEGNPEKFC
jgi:hypothetical protein